MGVSSRFVWRSDLRPGPEPPRVRPAPPPRLMVICRPIPKPNTAPLRPNRSPSLQFSALGNKNRSPLSTLQLSHTLPSSTVGRAVPPGVVNRA